MEPSFSRQPEIRAYLQRCAEEHEVLGAAWDDDAQRWRVETTAGPATAQLLVMASGALSDPLVPDLPGLDRFRGARLHSSRWDHGFDMLRDEGAAYAGALEAAGTPVRRLLVPGQGHGFIRLTGVNPDAAPRWSAPRGSGGRCWTGGSFLPRGISADPGSPDASALPSRSHA